MLTSQQNQNLQLRISRSLDQVSHRWGTDEKLIRLIEESRSQRSYLMSWLIWMNSYRRRKNQKENLQKLNPKHVCPFSMTSHKLTPGSISPNISIKQENRSGHSQATPANQRSPSNQSHSQLETVGQWQKQKCQVDERNSRLLVSRTLCSSNAFYWSEEKTEMVDAWQQSQSLTLWLRRCSRTLTLTSLQQWVGSPPLWFRISSTSLEVTMDEFQRRPTVSIYRSKNGPSCLLSLIEEMSWQPQ